MIRFAFITPHSFPNTNHWPLLPIGGSELLLIVYAHFCTSQRRGQPSFPATLTQWLDGNCLFPSVRDLKKKKKSFQSPVPYYY